MHDLGRYLFLAFAVYLGPGLLVGALIRYVRGRAFLARSVPTTGTVLACRYQASGEYGAEWYELTVTYRLPDGRERTFTEGYCDERRPGTQVKVLYEPDRPERSRVGFSRRDLWSKTVTMLFGAGVGMFLLWIFVCNEMYR